MPKSKTQGSYLDRLRQHWQRAELLRIICSRRMLVAFIMGFAAGLPLLLTIGVLQAWMKDAGVDLTVIGLMNLVQIPYTWKFLWAPLLDRYAIPLLGRRKGWLTLAQLALIAAIAASGAVSVSVPNGKLKVKAGQDATFTVKMTIKGWLLPGNFMNSGSQGANPDALTANEFDGYLVLDDGDHPIHMAWHVLPRQASNIVGRQVLNFDGGLDTIDLTNNGVGTAQNDAYSLIAISPNKPEGDFGAQAPMPDLRAVGVNTIPVPAGFCSANPSFLWLFAINTWERQEHLVPVSHQISLDTDQDGIFDYVVLNRDVSFNNVTDGRQLSWVFNLSTGSAGAFFFAEHSTNTGNTVLIICGEQIGLNADNFFQNVDAEVFAQDFYYGGPGDFIGGLTIAPLGEQYLGLPNDIPGKSEGTMDVLDFGPLPGNTPELGVMLIGNGDRGTGARGGSTQATEALLFDAN